jgi:replicative DNA helicase
MKKTEIVGILPPQAVEVEQAVLGALMIERGALAKISDLLTPDMFYQNAHKLIYNAISELEALSHPIDMLTVLDRLKKNGKHELIGGAYYLAELSSKVASSANIQFHARIIAEKYIQREIIYLCNAGATDSFESTTDTFNLLAELQNKIESLSNIGLSSSFTDGATLAAEEAKHFDRRCNKPFDIIGVSSGFPAIDEITMGWQPGHLVIIGGRPGMGKTAIMLELMSNAAKFGNPIGVISLEMSNQQLMQRLICSESKADSKRFRQGKSFDYEKIEIHEAFQTIGNRPLYFHNSEEKTFTKLRAYIKKMKTEKNIKLFFIDYLQLIIWNDTKINREQQVSNIARSLSNLAKELHICIIALSQLSREIDSRKDKRPQISDLRESGEIEQAAHIILFLYRPEYYKIMEDANGASTANLCQVEIAKNKDGSIGDVNLTFIAANQRFYSENMSTFESNNLIPISQIKDDKPPF